MEGRGGEGRGEGKGKEGKEDGPTKLEAETKKDLKKQAPIALVYRKKLYEVRAYLSLALLSSCKSIYLP